MYYGHRRKNDESDEINISPLIDMVFILLIFFIVTTSFSRETGVDISKPKASTAKSVDKENIMIAVTPEGSIHILEKQVDLSKLQIILKRLLAENPKRQVVLMADRRSHNGVVVDIIDVCNIVNVKKISISAIKK